MRPGEEVARPDGAVALLGITRFTMQEPALPGLPRWAGVPCWFCGDPIHETEAYYIASVETGGIYPAAALVHANHMEPAADALAPIIGEVWQAFSSLSDAQELLSQVPVPRQSTNNRISHAKRHLQGFLEWAEQNHPDAFVRAVTTLTCTLEDDQRHEEDMRRPRHRRNPLC